MFNAQLLKAVCDRECYKHIAFKFIFKIEERLDRITEDLFFSYPLTQMVKDLSPGKLSGFCKQVIFLNFVDSIHVFEKVVN